MRHLHYFPIVCLGGSTGSLDPFVQIVSGLGVNSGAAIVVINHARHFDSALQSILDRRTSMPVEVITDEMELERNKVYLIPRDRDLSIQEGHFRLSATSKPRGWPNVLTLFLESLTKEWQGTIIGIVLSGLDSDGAAALAAFKAVGGITFAQDPGSSQEPSMPQHAFETGWIDFLLPPPQIAQRLCSLLKDRPDA